MRQEILACDAPFLVEFVADSIELQLPERPTGWRLVFPSYPAVSLPQSRFASDILIYIHVVMLQNTDKDSYIQSCYSVHAVTFIIICNYVWPIGRFLIGFINCMSVWHSSPTFIRIFA